MVRCNPQLHLRSIIKLYAQLNSMIDTVTIIMFTCIEITDEWRCCWVSVHSTSVAQRCTTLTLYVRSPDSTHYTVARNTGTHITISCIYIHT